MRARLAMVVVLSLAACDKVPLVQVNSAFTRADAVWFEDEQTLFVFYRFESDQGIEPVSVVELTWRTDAEAHDWQPLVAFAPVHTHLPVDCGPHTRCGSWSLKVDQVPREVGLRLRYHPKGALAFETNTTPFVVASGPAWTSRSLVAYGVFDGTNAHVQWRARHTFPNLRNEEVEGYGLRRALRITDAHTGDVPPATEDNPYWYAVPSCDGAALGWPDRSTTERAVFEPTQVPVLSATDSTVCATATVTDAKGEFAAVAVARKNSEIRPAFPSLHSPVKTAVQVPFLLKPCDRVISDSHLAMQRQRLLLSGEQVVCLDTWQDPGFATSLTTTFRQALNLARTSGNDMVLTIALHHDDTSGRLAQAVVDALTATLVPERDKVSPRAVGAFVLDSFGRRLTNNDARQLALWCPSLTATDLDLVPATSERDCALLPDTPDFVLGPFKFNTLPILPTRDQFETFVAKYSEAQTGQMKTLQFLAPQLTAVSVNVPVGTFGVATFFNNEQITPAPQDAFSYCAPATPGASSLLVFRVAAAPMMPFPLQQLPELHRLMPQPAYALGLAWDSPFLLRLSYEVVLAGQASAFSLSAPFGFRSVSERYFANSLWLQSDFDLRQVLTQCTRFCDAPTFDSDGVYNVNKPFRQSYEVGCYTPSFPTLADAGVPSDP
jgi:hypothetical protein